MKWVYLVIAVVAETIGTSSLKASESFTKIIPSLIMIVSYGTSFYFLSLTLRYLPVGIAYALWSGIGIILISTFSYFFFRQTLDLPAISGLTLIIIGIAVINLFSKTVGH